MKIRTTKKVIKEFMIKGRKTPLAHESPYFAAALLAAASALRESPHEAKELSEVSKAIAAAKIFRMDPKPGSKS